MRPPPARNLVPVRMSWRASPVVPARPEDSYELPYFGQTETGPYYGYSGPHFWLALHGWLRPWLQSTRSVVSGCLGCDGFQASRRRSSRPLCVREEFGRGFGFYFFFGEFGQGVPFGWGLFIALRRPWRPAARSLCDGHSVLREGEENVHGFHGFSFFSGLGAGTWGLQSLLLPDQSLHPRQALSPLCDRVSFLLSPLPILACAISCWRRSIAARPLS